MLMRTRRKWFILRAIIVGEAVAFLATFRIWRKMNRDQEYRKWMHDNYPSILEGFYIGAEMGGYTAVRYDDMEAWNSEQN